MAWTRSRTKTKTMSTNITQNAERNKVTDFSHNPLVNGSESLWSSSSRVVVSSSPWQQPSDHLPLLSTHMRAHTQLVLSSPAMSLVPYLPASPAHPSTQQAFFFSGVHVGVQSSSAPGGWMWGRRRQQKRKAFSSKFSYGVLARRAMGQRAVRPKLQRQYIMPLESNQLSVIGS